MPKPLASTVAEFLSSSAKLGTARPVSPEAAAESDSDSDSEVSLDERVLMLQRFNDEENGVDWIGEFAGSSEEEGGSDDEEDEESEGDEEAEARHRGSLRRGGSEARKPAVTISGRPAPPLPKAPQPQAPRAAVRSSALTAPRAVEAEAIPSVRADALAGIPVFKKEPISAPAKRGPTAAHPADGLREDGAAPTSEPPAAGGPKTSRPPKPARPALPAFMPEEPERCLYVGNLPHDASSDAAVKEALKRFGKVRQVHLEVNNNGKPAGFAYVEFKAPSSVAAAVEGASATPLEVGGRPLRLLAYTPNLNYRNPDGSRKREKAGKAPAHPVDGRGPAKKEKQGGGGEGGGAAAAVGGKPGRPPAHQPAAVAGKRRRQERNEDS
jgi:hypothetical protein